MTMNIKDKIMFEFEHFNYFFVQNKHPHIIYEFSDKSPQGCALDTNYGNYGSRSGGYNSRRKRDVPSSEKDSSIDIESLIDPLPSSPRSFLFEEDTTQNLLRMRKSINDLLSNVTNSGKSKRDVRDSKKFIELALIIDKAMVRDLLFFYQNLRGLRKV